VEKHWVNCRYTPQNKQEIFDSRTDATRAIGLAIREATVPPKLWINAASATIYRHAQDRPQDEYTGEYHNDFSVLVCKQWEKTFEGQRTPFTRKIAMRMAITLGDGGRAIEWFLDRPELEGVYNLASPGTVTNSYFMSTLRRLTGHRIGLPAPAWLLKLGTAIIGTEAATAEISFVLTKQGAGTNCNL
jgi:NAD dependent epimerase/dehydratase family enzyme